MTPPENIIVHIVCSQAVVLFADTGVTLRDRLQRLQVSHSFNCVGRAINRVSDSEEMWQISSLFSFRPELLPNNLHPR